MRERRWKIRQVRAFGIIVDPTPSQDGEEISRHRMSPSNQGTRSFTTSTRPVPRRSKVFHLGSSLASVFLTLDRDIPNCRAILAGVMPALNAARTAFT
jgi:hypothetical protein